MVHQERHGQLVCIRVTWPVSKEDMAAFLANAAKAREAAAQAGIPPARAVLVDLRSGDVVPQEAAQGFLMAMRSDAIRRLAVLTKAGAAIQNQQANRLVREAGEGRRTFHDVAEARAWVAELLPAEEVPLLDRFLAGDLQSTAG